MRQIIHATGSCEIDGVKLNSIPMKFVIFKIRDVNQKREIQARWDARKLREKTGKPKLDNQPGRRL